MKVPMITGTNFEESDLAFTSKVMRHNALIGIPLDYLLRSDGVENYNVAWKYREEKLKFCASLRGKSFNDDAKTLYNLLVQYVGTYGTVSNTVSCHTRSKNEKKCYIELKENLKTESYEDKKAWEANAIL